MWWLVIQLEVPSWLIKQAAWPGQPDDTRQCHTACSEVYYTGYYSTVYTLRDREDMLSYYRKEAGWDILMSLRQEKHDVLQGRWIALEAVASRILEHPDKAALMVDRNISICSRFLRVKDNWGMYQTDRGGCRSKLIYYNNMCVLTHFRPF